MNDYLAKSQYPQETSPMGLGVQEDLLSRYKRQLEDNKGRSERLEKLITLLEENPQVTEIIQLMGRV